VGISLAAALAYAAALPVSAATQQAMADVPEATAPFAMSGFYEMPASGDERLKFERARVLAIDLLTESKGVDTSLAELAREAAAELTTAKLFIAGDAEADRKCAAITAALFVRQDLPGHIYICADTRWHVLHESDVSNIIAQILIHEGAHLAGTTDECEATTLELVVAGNSIGIANYGNFHRYAGQCRGSLSHRALRRRGLRM
jgi:hypothetical protein